MNSKATIVELQQLWHGYRRGHELLASSTGLTQEDLDEVARLSDLSGLQIVDKTPPHVTCYPLPSRKYFAIAKTWIDESAQRQGCVVTHTLLVPMDAWSNGLSASAVAENFAKPTSRESATLASLRVRLPTSGSLGEIAHPPGLLDFCEKFFVRGVAAVVWPIDAHRAYEAEATLLRVLDVLWRSRKREFTASSYCLQPRKFAGSPFALAFVPGGAIGRFSATAKEMVVNPQSEFIPGVAGDRQWKLLRYFVNLVETGNHELSDRMLNLLDLIPSTPDAMAKVALLEDLCRRSIGNPVASIAAVDVIGALAPAAGAAVEHKRWIVANAIESCTAQADATTVEFLSVLELRLRRGAFRHVADLRRRNKAELQRAVELNLESALSVATKLKPAPTALLAAIGDCIGRLKSPGNVISRFAEESERAFYRMVALRPVVFVAYLDDQTATQLDRDIAIKTVEAHSVLMSPWHRARLYRALSGSVVALGSDPLLTGVLFFAREHEVTRIIGALNEDHLVGVTEIPRRLYDFLRQRAEFAIKVLKESGVRTNVVARLWGGLISESVLDVLHFNSVEFSHAETRAISVSEYLSALRVRSNPHVASYFVIELLGRPMWQSMVSNRIIRDLIESASFADVVASQDSYVLQSAYRYKECRMLAGPITSGALFNDLVGDSGLPSDLLPHILTFLEQEATATVRETLRDCPWRSASSAACWGVFSRITPALVRRNEPTVLDFMKFCIDVTKGSLDSSSVSYWVNVLRGTSGSRFSLPAMQESLNFALQSGRQPVGPILMMAFAPVYQALPKPKSKPRRKGFLDLLILPTPPDRRKDLRNRLVDSYVQSLWPPEDLATIAYRCGFLDKCFRRLMAYGHNGYLERIQEGLLACSDDASRRAAHELRHMTKDALGN